MGLQPDEAIISYRPRDGGCDYTEWVTIAPIGVRLAEHTTPADLTGGRERRHFRWVQRRHSTNKPFAEADFEKRQQEIRQLGEISRLLTEDDGFVSVGSSVKGSWAYRWKSPPNLFKDRHQGPLVFERLNGFGAFEIWCRSTESLQAWQNKLDDALKNDLPIEEALSLLQRVSPAQKIARYLLAFFDVSLVLTCWPQRS